LSRDSCDSDSEYPFFLQFANTRRPQRERELWKMEGVGAIFLDSNLEAVGLGGTHSSPLSLP